MVDMESSHSLTLSEAKLNKGEVICSKCNIGRYKPLNPKYPINHCFICDNCGERLLVESNVIID